ncbi:MAG: HAD family hydrolase [Aquabacterium sp.]|uniref:HAD family hydrolase n=1 Tax=Aquabacterium sp. TaxID=1872578 RepID=UPI003BBC9A03
MSSALMRLLQSRQLLIFDFDGTIADTSPLHAQAFTQALSGKGLAVHYPDIAGLKTADAVRFCAERAGVMLREDEVQSLVQAKQGLVRTLMASNLQALPGAGDFLQRVARTHRLAMVTSGSRGTVSLGLNKLGHTDLFNPLICADDVAHAKPSPEGFLKALDMVGVSADRALVFEDSAAGLTAAHQAGIATIKIETDTWTALLKDLK